VLVRKTIAIYMIRRVHDPTVMPELHSYVVRCSPRKTQFAVAHSLAKSVSGAPQQLRRLTSHST